MARRKEGPRAWVRESHHTRKVERLPSSKRRWEVLYETGEYRANKAGQLKPVKRTKGGFTSKSAAEVYRDTETPAAKFNAGTPYVDAHRGDRLFHAVAEEWLGTYIPPNGKARGKAQHHQLLTGPRSLIRKQWTDWRIGDIDHGDVATWVAQVQAIRKPTTVRHNFYSFRLVMQYAVAEGLIVRDPTVGIKMPKQLSTKAQQRKRVRLKGAQVAAIIEAAPHPWSLYPLLAAKTGMRPEELCGLQLGDFSSDLRAVTVKRVSVRDEISKRWIYEDAGKTPAAHRRITLDAYTVGRVHEYLDLHAERAGRFFSAHPDRMPDDPATLPLFPWVGDFRRGHKQRQSTPDVDTWVFADEDRNPTPLRHGWWTLRYWDTIKAAASLPPKATFYDLRHFHASWHADRLGMPGALTIAELSERLGHANTSMTLDRYVRPDPDAEKWDASAGMFEDAAPANVVAFPA